MTCLVLWMEIPRVRYFKTCLVPRACFGKEKLRRWSWLQTRASPLFLDGVNSQHGIWLTFSARTAQFFPVADQIVILEDGGVIKAQGTWEAIKHHASSSISKFRLQEHQAGHDRGSAKPSSQSRQEAQADLARKTGDFGLYRQCQCGWLYERDASPEC